MNLSTLFRIEEKLNLDKKTLVILRWIAILGQLVAINLVFFVLKFNFLIFEAHLIIFAGLLTNLYLQFVIKTVRLKDLYASIFLIYDLIQLSLLLYLTGGISNPFSILLIIPSIVSSTFLSMGTTIILGFFTIVFLYLLTVFHKPLPGIHENSFTFPEFYLFGFFISIIIGLIFLCYFGIRFAGETKKRSNALQKLQQIISKEYELESLGGQAAAAAHSLATPLATISVVAKELKKDIGENSSHKNDLDLLISQTKRCSEILKQISKKEIVEDKFFSSIKFEDLLNEIVESFEQTSEKAISLSSDNDRNKFDIKRSPETIYGLRNFIGNAVKFANENVSISLKSNKDFVTIFIEDDGPGFPEDIIGILGEPYIRSKHSKINLKSGTGLGTFLGKTLLERNGAVIKFTNSKKLGGAGVIISWQIKNLKA